MRILCIDFDDVIFNTKPAVEKIIDGIEEKATGKYLKRIIAETKDADEKTKLEREHYNYKDRVLEEVDDKYKGLIDYDAIFSTDDVFPGTIDYINYLINCGYYEKVYILSHCNVEREVEAKKRFLKRFFSNLELISVPYHIEKYRPNLERKPTSKAEYFMKYTGITDLSRCTLIDDSNSNCNNWRDHGGIAIKYNASGSMNFEYQEINSLHPFAINIIESEQVSESVSRKK